MSMIISRCKTCTNLIITREASSMNDSLITYSADSNWRYGYLDYYPAGSHPPGSMRKIIGWDSHEYRGEIPEAAHTYKVVGNMNEYELVITESTFVGRRDYATQPGSIMEYGSLIYITLQRARNVEEAFETMQSLTSLYGYDSGGESFTVADKEESWIFEIMSRGPGEVGALWVAKRIPPGAISAHANQARIHKLDIGHNNTCRYSPDLFQFLRGKGLLSPTTPDSEFSFAETFDPMSFHGARYCSARVWAFFNKYSVNMEEYLPLVEGKNLSMHLPLWVYPTSKLSLGDVRNMMRDHFEGTWFDMRYDIGAEAFRLPYRWRPLSYAYLDHTYCNDRTIGTQQTGFHIIAQLRSDLPNFMGILWFGVDDATFSVHAPFYMGLTEVPSAWGPPVSGHSDLQTFSLNSAFWVFNLVANYAYTRYDLIYPQIARKILDIDLQLLEEMREIEGKAQDVYKIDPLIASHMLGEFSKNKGSWLVDEWTTYFGYLFTRYMDGNVKTKVKGEYLPRVEWPGYSKEWHRRIVEEDGKKYRFPS